VVLVGVGAERDQLVEMGETAREPAASRD